MAMRTPQHMTTPRATVTHSMTSRDGPELGDGRRADDAVVFASAAADDDFADDGGAAAGVDDAG